MFRELILSTCFVLALGLAGNASASVELVGGDTLNGNFNNLITPSTTDAQPFSNMVAWVNLNGDQNAQATRTNILYDGTRNAVLSTSTSKVFGLDTGHIIVTGESYDISYVWRDASGWADNTSEVRVSLFVTDDNTIMGTRTNLVQDLSGLSTADSTWEEVIREGVYTATSADAGKTLFVSIDTTATGGFARLENFTLSVGTPPTIASSSNPTNNSEDAPPDTRLSWIPGASAVSHDVYFGTVFDDVSNASRTNPRGVLASQGQVAATYDPPGRLDLGQTYYWRIDDVSAPPASAIFKGDVWSFTVEPIAYPINATSIAATASSSNKAEEGPENTINGSGLATAELHSAEPTDMWLSSMTGAPPTWIQYEFDRVYKLHQMVVWNYNSSVEPAIGFGVKEAAIEYSLDGANWTTLGTTHEFARGPGAAGYAANTTIDLGGAAAKYVRITANSNWGGLVPQFGLSEVRFFSIPVLAREPDPVSGATDIGVDATLSWRTGREAATHNVYLSSDEQTVIDGTAPAVTVTSPSYAPSLDLAGTYYWRIDEVNDAETPTTWQGDVWSFSTQEYLVVEDFESYNDIPAGEEGSNLVYETWADGYASPTTNGSTIGYTEAFQPSMESSTVYDGKLSVPLFYNNTVASISEVTANVANLQAGQDWSKYGIKGLTLRFSGDPNNVPQQMYAKVNGTKVICDGDAENLKFRGWQMWYIDLASLGVNLSNVTTLTIGFERISGAGGQGMVLLDGIRLYSYDRQLITPAAPDTANLVGHWTFDEGAGTTAADSSAMKNNGTITGGAQWVAGHVGGALKFNGAEYVVIPPAAWSPIDMQLTVAFWAFGDDALGNNWGFYAGDSAGRLAGCHIPWGDTVVFDTTSGWERIQRAAAADEVRGRWHYWTFVKNADSGDKEIYLDGKLWHSGSGVTSPIADVTEFNIGAGSGGVSPYIGMIDDFRLYNRALSPGEVAGLAGVTVPFDKPF